MQISFTQREVSSSLTLALAIMGAFPKKIRQGAMDKLRDMEAELNSIIQAKNSNLEEAVVIELIGDFNERFAEDSQGVRAYLTLEVELLVTYDPDVIVEVIEAVNREVPTLTGMAFTLYGLMLGFGSSLKRIGESIKQSVKSRYED